MLNKEFLYPGDIIEFHDIALYSNKVYATVLSTSYNVNTSYKAITTTFSSSIECNQVIRRIKTTTRNKTIVDVQPNHGQYKALELFDFQTYFNEMDIIVRPPTDGLVRKYIKDMCQKYADEELFKKIPGQGITDKKKEGDYQIHANQVIKEKRKEGEQHSE